MDDLIKQLKSAGLTFEDGLSDSEIAKVEAAIGAPLPPDLRKFYQVALPTKGIPGEGGWASFPTWRSDPKGAAKKGQQYLESCFGARKIKDLPPLIPIYSHRFMPSYPYKEGNPVISTVGPEDTIYYGANLEEYLSNEFLRNPKDRRDGMLSRGSFPLILKWHNVLFPDEILRPGMSKLVLKYPEDLKSLRIQIYGRSYFANSLKVLENTISHEVFPGVIAVIVVDQPEMVTTLNTKYNPDFKGHAAEVFKFCYEQLKKQNALKLEYLEVTDQGDTVAALEGPDILSASQILVLKDLYPQLAGKNKEYLFAVPNRHLILVKTVTDDTPALAAAGMRRAAHLSYERNAQVSISPEVYMYKDGKYFQLEFKNSIN